MEHSCIYDARNWSYRPQDWPHGFDFTTRAHSVGLKTSLYLGKLPRYCWHLGCILKSAMNIMLRTGGSYHDVNLSTIAGRDAELNAVRDRYDQGYMDMWRTDTCKKLRETLFWVSCRLKVLSRACLCRHGAGESSAGQLCRRDELHAYRRYDDRDAAGL